MENKKYQTETSGSEEKIVRLAPGEKNDPPIKWIDFGNVENFFSRKLGQFSSSKQGGDWDGGYAEWLEKNGKRSGSESDDEYKREMQERRAKYEAALVRMRAGDFQPALEEIEEVGFENISWNKDLKALEHSGPDNQLELRAMAVFLTDEIGRKKKTAEPATTEQELDGYFSELIKTWNLLDDDDHSVWLREAVRTKNHKALADQIDVSISGATFELHQVEGQDSKMASERDLLLGRGQTSYLHQQLADLRRFRKYLFEKSD
ncbi:MAG: hypothetical protein Q8L10_01660 [Candidatus Moranbacteria bacterium]|nr:hypothetical protein [Candidatus Moranbacteria bacterium]